MRIGTNLLIVLATLAVASFPSGAVGHATPVVQAATAVSCSPGYNLTASPDSGVAPLEVAFALTAPGLPATAVRWSFGDGSYWNGSGPQFFDPIHVYTRGGSAVVSVAMEGPVPGSCRAVLNITSPALQIAAHGSPVFGTAPLSVSFAANFSGGSGTIVSAWWTFGDGGSGSGLAVLHTYSAPGSYVAAVSGVDSSGAEAGALVQVNVTAGTPFPGTAGSGRAGGLTSGQWWAVGTGLITLMAALGLWTIFRAPRFPPPGERWSATFRPAAPATAPGEPAPGVEADPDQTLWRVGRPRVRPDGPPPSVERSPEPSISPATVRLSHRVLVHLSQHGAAVGDSVAPRSFTQAGIAEQLGARQSAVSNALNRLVRAGVLRSSVGHVEGEKRRLRRYELTPLGEELAFELRRRGGP